MFSGSRVVENMANPYNSNNPIIKDEDSSNIIYENKAGGFSTISANELKEATRQAIEQGYTEVCDKNLVINKHIASVMISYTYNDIQTQIPLTDLKIANLTSEKNKIGICPKIGTNQQPADTLKNSQNAQTLQELEQIEDTSGVIYNEGTNTKLAPQNYSVDTGVTNPSTQQELIKRAVTLKELIEQRENQLERIYDNQPRRPISPETSYDINQENQSGENQLEQQMESAPPTQ